MADNLPKSSSSAIKRERTRLSAEERRSMLVEAAYQLIAEKGLLGLRIRDVADRVGVNHTTVIYYFPSRESLISAVIEYVGSLFVTIQAPRSMTERISSPHERLHAYFANLAYQIQNSPQHFLVIDELFLEARRDPVLHQLVQAEVIWANHLTAIIEDGIRHGVFFPNVPTVLLVNTIMIFCKGLPLHSPKSEDITRTIEQFEQWVMQSLLRR